MKYVANADDRRMWDLRRLTGTYQAAIAAADEAGVFSLPSSNLPGY
jgi:hypothetical protein